MPEQNPSLATFYSPGWSRFQRGLVGMIASLSPEQLALPSGSHHWPIGLVVQHLVGNRVWWFRLWMGQGSPELEPLAHWDPADPLEQAPLDAPALVDGLQKTWQMIDDALSHFSAGDLEHRFSPPDSITPEEREIFGPTSLQWIVWHVLEHEILHAGELSLSLGSYGLPGFYGDA